MAAPGGPNSAAGTAKNFVISIKFPIFHYKQRQENLVLLLKELSIERNIKAVGTVSEEGRAGTPEVPSPPGSSRQSSWMQFHGP